MARKISWSRKLDAKHTQPVWTDYEGYLVTAYTDKKPTKKEQMAYAKKIINARKKLRGVM